MDRRGAALAHARAWEWEERRLRRLAEASARRAEAWCDRGCVAAAEANARDYRALRWQADAAFMYAAGWRIISEAEGGLSWGT